MAGAADPISRMNKAKKKCAQPLRVVGRKKARFARCAGRDAGAKRMCLSARRGALPMMIDDTRYEHEIRRLAGISIDGVKKSQQSFAGSRRMVGKQESD